MDDAGINVTQVYRLKGWIPLGFQIFLGQKIHQGYRTN